MSCCVTAASKSMCRIGCLAVASDVEDPPKFAMNEESLETGGSVTERVGAGACASASAGAGVGAGAGAGVCACWAAIALLTAPVSIRGGEAARGRLRVSGELGAVATEIGDVQARLRLLETYEPWPLAYALGPIYPRLHAKTCPRPMRERITPPEERPRNLWIGTWAGE